MDLDPPDIVSFDPDSEYYVPRTEPRHPLPPPQVDTQIIPPDRLANVMRLPNFAPLPEHPLPPPGSADPNSGPDEEVPPMPGTELERYRNEPVRESQYRALENVTGALGALPRNRALAIINARRKIQIWEQAKELRTPPVPATDMILKAYNLVWQEEDFEWDPPAMAGLRDWWGVNDRHSERLVQDFRNFLAAQRDVQEHLLRAVHKKRKDWIRSEIEDLLTMLRLTNPERHEYAQEFMEEYGDEIKGDIFKYWALEDMLLMSNQLEIDALYNSVLYLSQNGAE